MATIIDHFVSHVALCKPGDVHPSWTLDRDSAFDRHVENEPAVVMLRDGKFEWAAVETQNGLDIAEWFISKFN